MSKILRPSPGVWRGYLSVMDLAMQRTLTYRVRYLMGILIGFIQIGMLYYIWSAIYINQSDIAGYDWTQIRTYLFIGYALNLLVTNLIETQMSRSIRDGSISMELIKPIQYLHLKLFEALGTSLVEGLAVGAVSGVFVAILFHISAPNTANLPFFVIAFLAAFLLRLLLAVNTALLCFWTTSVLGLIWARQAIAMFFSGALVPLALLPGWLETVALCLPFQGTMHTPAMLYLGRVTGWEAVAALTVQIVWAVLLWFSAVWLLRRGLSRLDVLGG